jgi:RHS repeat-associated protein
LTQVQKNKGSTVLSTANFSYDGRNTRLSQTYGGKTTNYLQDTTSLPVVLQETLNSQTSSFMYPLGSTSPLFQSDASNAPLWYHADGLGSIRALTDGSGAIKNTNSYSAFGGNEGATGKAANTHLFAGEQLDPTGLYFNRARYYSSNIGRFITTDDYRGELENPISQNRFIYVEDNPINLVDPSGKTSEGPEKIALAVVCTIAFFNFMDPSCDFDGNLNSYLTDEILTALSELGIEGWQFETLVYPKRGTRFPNQDNPSPRSLSNRGPDMAVRNDNGVIGLFTLAFLCDTEIWGGIYEVKHVNKLAIARVQAISYTGLANSARNWASPEYDFYHYNDRLWRRGIGLVGLHLMLTISYGTTPRSRGPGAGYIYDQVMEIWWAEPGIILFDIWKQERKEKGKEEKPKKLNERSSVPIPRPR